MPELPEVEALTRFLTTRVSGRRVERCELGAIAALKTFDPPLVVARGTHEARSVTRRGKYLCMDLDGEWLVMHLARGAGSGGRTSFPPSGSGRAGARWRLRMGFEGGSGFDVTEMGTEKRLALWVVGDPEEVEGLATLGIDPLDASFDTERPGPAARRARRAT